MKHEIIKYLPYLLSIITAYSMLLAGNKKKSAWFVGLVNQLLWLVWIVLSGTWGLIPMNIVLWIVYGRNYLKWSK
jgi:hypothetical protein